jgi:predicted porin
MKKALVALAVAGAVAQVAQADNVVIYGRLNTAAQYTKVQDGAKDSTLANQNSRFGLKGEEKLGNGLTAEFQIENGFDSANGGSNSSTLSLASRDTFVGVKGDFGGVRLGRNETPTWKLFDVTVSKFHHAGIADFTGQSAGTATNYGSISRVADLGARLGKSVIYTSPSVSGVTGALQVADSANGAIKNIVDGSLVYGNGASPITAGFAFRTDKDNATGNKDTIYTLAGKYKQDLFDVSAAWEHDDLKSVASGRKRDVAFVSGQYNVSTNAALVGSLAFAGKTKDNGTSVADSQAAQYTLGGQYDLSARTQVYGYYTKLDNKAGSNYSFSGSPVSANQDTQGVVVGLRHNF